MRKTEVVLGVLLPGIILLSGACGDHHVASPPQDTASALETDWRPLDGSEMTPGLEAQVERSMMAVRDLSSGLLSALSEGLDAQGPSGGIDICRTKAPEIAAAVSDKYHLKIGRTSFRLRNPNNTAPSWAEAAVRDRLDTAKYFRGPHGELGVLAPIRLRSQCLMCHGKSEDIDPEVAIALRENYPDDQATGFAENDLRGWFWVETPPAD